ncbi:MAG: PEP-CTERM sorting domain-containing protein [Phycisphaerales bacterium]|nr:PEP-CTERM sorting domain-containing protein [Phycisphaerales bacterium]
MTSDGTFGAGTATFTKFSHVPAPGALALVGLAGMAGRRRRAR